GDRPMPGHANPDLTKLILANNIEEQCSVISGWLKQQYNLDVVGFFLDDPRTSRAHFFAQNVPMNMAGKFEALLDGVNRSDEVGHGTLFFSQNGEALDRFGFKNPVESTNTIGVAIPLKDRGQSIGTLALLADATMAQELKTKPENASFVPLVSSLLENAFSHELKDSKIRMLNLYQTVSSSMAYIGNLQELLTTITGIVTSELLCEESSILLYDEDTNEFEFFTAFGETGMELVSTRFPADRGIAGRALRELKTQVVNDTQIDPDFYCAIDEEHGFKTRNIISAPLISGDEKVGVINALNKIQTHFFSKEDDQVLSAIADEVALAVKNAKLFEFVVNSYCKIRQGLNSCKGCKRPLKSWTPCVRQLEMV
ncbi:MAG: GAF domain-containing protein, partial [Desulfobacterales bacterium]